MTLGWQGSAFVTTFEIFEAVEMVDFSFVIFCLNFSSTLARTKCENGVEEVRGT